VQLLEPMFFEPTEEEGHEAFDKAAAPTTDSPFVFTLKDTLKRLDAAPADPTGPFGTQIELGAPALDTTALFMMRLAPGKRTPTHPTPAHNTFAGGRGRGPPTLRGRRLEWRRAARL